MPSPPIFAGPQVNGGVTILAANSAALLELITLKFNALETLGDTFARWLDEQIEARKAPPKQWTHDTTIDVLSGRRQVLVYDFVYRELQRHIGGAAIEEMLGAAAMWDFASRSRNEQFTAARAAEQRHATQQKVDAQALAALDHIYAVSE